MTFLRPIAARLAAAVVGALVSWLTVKGIDVPADTQQAWIEATVGLMLLVFGIVYALAHKLINRKLNPADAATPGLAKIGKMEQRAISHPYPAGVELGDETGG